MSTTVNIELPLIVGSQDGAITNHDTALFMLDAMVQGRVIQRDLTTPPAAALGDVYIVPTGVDAASLWDPDSDGAYVGFLAVYDGTGWKFYEPKEGWTAWVTTENVVVRHDGTSWKTVTGEAHFGAYDSAGGISITSATPITWDTETRKDSGVFTHSASSDQIVVSEAGWYEISYVVGYVVSGTTGNNVIDSYVTQNGSTVDGSQSTVDLNSNTITHGLTESRVLVNCAATDIIRVVSVKTSGSGTVATHAKRSKVHIRRI